MRKAYLALFASLVAMTSFGQSLQHTVINSTGGYIGMPGGMQMIISVGEPIIGIAETQEAGLAQGFLGGSKTVIAAPSGIQDIAQDDAVIYPNPFSSTIQIRSDQTNIHIIVYNSMGQQVYSGLYTAGGINLSQLAAGIYMIHASVNDKTISNTKILKQ